MTLGVPAPQTPVREGIPPERVALVDLLDRLLATGVVLTGDIIISIAEVDLVHISLRALLRSIDGGGPSTSAEDGEVSE